MFVESDGGLGWLGCCCVGDGVVDVVGIVDVGGGQCCFGGWFDYVGVVVGGVGLVIGLDFVVLVLVVVKEGMYGVFCVCEGQQIRFV